ncbi:MAG: hypothetical protein LJE65_03580 [Desulfobacteraceae bacterium]|nr:hypothetical protein [Desulfobacteraceae bacterium]
MEDPGHCRHLDRLGTRSVDKRKPDTCPVCGSDYSLLVWVKGFKMCGLCAENIDQALRILRHKHRKRLGAILIALDRESP